MTLIENIEGGDYTQWSGNNCHQYKNVSNSKVNTYSEPQVIHVFHPFLLSCWLYKYTVHHLLCLYY